jgi:CRISPR-associated protein Csb3
MATPVSVSRFSQILTSGAFDAAAWQEADDEAERSLQLAPRADRDWLKEQGVHAIVRFPILKVGSPSAPERQIATGTLEVL